MIITCSYNIHDFIYVQVRSVFGQVIITCSYNIHDFIYVQVRSVFGQVIITMAHHQYLELEGGHSLVEFLVKQCAINPDDKVSYEIYVRVSYIKGGGIPPPPPPSLSLPYPRFSTKFTSTYCMFQVHKTNCIIKFQYAYFFSSNNSKISANSILVICRHERIRNKGKLKKKSGISFPLFLILSCLHITNNTSDKSYAVSIVSNK